MNASEREPLEQIDYGTGYQARFSPQSHATIKVEGGSLAIAIALIALGGVIVGAITLPILAQKASEPIAVRSQIAEREARVAIDQVQTMRIELARKGIFVNTDDHQ